MVMKRALILAALLLTPFSQLAQADTRSDVKAAFSRCDVFADDRTWLNCVYGAAQPMRGKLGLPSAPLSQTNLVPSMALTPQPALAPRPAPPAVVAAPARQNESRSAILSYLLGGEPVLTDVPLTAFSVSHDGLFTLTLANGQVWREVEGSPTPHWHEPASRYMASISKGSLDSYNMMIVSEGITYKVQRVR
jgi:hypothetical protein